MGLTRVFACCASSGTITFPLRTRLTMRVQFSMPSPFDRTIQHQLASRPGGAILHEAARARSEAIIEAEVTTPSGVCPSGELVDILFSEGRTEGTCYGCDDWHSCLGLRGEDESARDGNIIPRYSGSRIAPSIRSHRVHSYASRAVQRAFDANPVGGTPRVYRVATTLRASC